VLSFGLLDQRALQAFLVREMSSAARAPSTADCAPLTAAW
jgi:hypothetical protein